MERPRFRLSGPVLDSPQPLKLASFYEQLLGWPIAGSEGPEAGSSEDYGWAVLRSPDGLQKIEIQWEPRYVRPTWPAEEGERPHRREPAREEGLLFGHGERCGDDPAEPVASQSGDDLGDR